MRHITRVYQADTLHHPAENQEPAEENYNGDRRHEWIDQRKDSANHHQGALNQIPQRMPSDRLPHRLAHDLRGSIN